MEQLSKKQERELKHEQKSAAEQAAQKRRTTERLALWGTVAVLIIGIFVAIWKLSDKSTVPTSTNGSIAAVSDSDHIAGNPMAVTTLVEYSDFQCPACSAFYPYVHDLLKSNGGNFRLVYRHFPLQQHIHADLAARATEAAGLQNKFWEMHDLLFERQKDWAEAPNAEDMFVGYATSLSLDVAKFKTDLHSDAVAARVNKDLNEGISAGINSTPTFFLNQNLLQLTNFSDLAKAVTDAINKK